MDAATAPPRGRQMVLAVVVTLGVLGALRVGAPVQSPAGVMALPGVGSVGARLLEDGAPVFVHHVTAGEVVVLEALAPTPVGGRPVGELVAWCGARDLFVAAHHGRVWGPDGRRRVGASPGRLPGGRELDGADLTARAATLIEGRVATGDPVRVGPALDSGGTEAVRPTIASVHDTLGPPGSCRRPARPRIRPLPPEPASADPEPLDHAAFARALPAAPAEGWHVARGAIVVQPDGAAVLCQEASVAVGESCAEPHPVPVRLGLDEEDTGGAAAVLEGPVALRIDGGAVVRAAVLFSGEWRGSSLRGAVVYDAVVERLDLDASVLRVRPDAAERPRCVGPSRPDPGSVLPPPGVQYVDTDTRFDVAGTRDPERVADTVAEGEPIRVEVRADAGTCRALLVTATG